MHAWGELVLFNAVGASVLAVVVALVGRWIRRPALLHALWIVVLLKLVSYPAAEVALVPRYSSPPEFAAARATPRTDPGLPGHAAPGRSRDVGPEWSPAETQESGERQVPLSWLLLAAAGAGALVVIGSAVGRSVRMRRLLGRALDAPEDVQGRVGRLARRFGFARAPRVRWVPARMSPAVWPTPAGGEILFPAHLSARLSGLELDALLAHEVAHLRRRDPCVRFLELLVIALYWWHPIAWWARRNLRLAEERACDALVVEKLPHATRAYVEGLLKTAEFVARGGSRAPEVATANDAANHLKERVIMILTAKPTQPLSPTTRGIILTVAAAAILTSPAWIDRPAAVVAEPPQEEVSFAREQLAIEKDLHELEMRRLQIRQQIEETQAARQAEQFRREILALQSQDRSADAEALQRELTRLEREMAARRERFQWERDHEMERSKLGFQLRELTLQREDLLARGDENAASQVLERMHELELQVRDLELRAQRGEIERARKQLEQELEELKRVQAGE